jgi:hypothetical protein
VQYAQHKHVVRYDYARLQAYWKAVREGTKQIPGLKRQVLDNLKVIDDVDDRPPAFVARGTHATYAVPCPPLRRGKPCRELVDAAAPENHHDGFESWVRNQTVPCLRTACLQLLPTRDRGREPALWNAYDGLWGDQRCILSGTYCNVERSPNSPGGQPRYKNPVAIAAYMDDPEGKPTRCAPGPKPCPDPPAPGH